MISDGFRKGNWGECVYIYIYINLLKYDERENEERERYLLYISWYRMESMRGLYIGCNIF